MFVRLRFYRACQTRPQEFARSLSPLGVTGWDLFYARPSATAIAAFPDATPIYDLDLRFDSNEARDLFMARREWMDQYIAAA